MLELSVKTIKPKLNLGFDWVTFLLLVLFWVFLKQEMVFAYFLEQMGSLGSLPGEKVNVGGKH